MAEGVWSDGYLALESTNLSTYVRNMSFVIEKDAVDGTAMGDSARAMFSGLLAWSAEVEFNAHSTALDSVIDSLVGVTSGVAFAIRESTAALTTENPEYVGTCVITSWTPFSGGIGEMRISNLSLVANSDIARNTA